MLRVFVGIRVPPAQCLSLSLLCSGLHGAKWVDPGNFHVTLRFIGEVAEPVVEDIHNALETIELPGFPLAIGGLGIFGTPQRPASLYAGLEKSEPLLKLYTRVESVLNRIGVPPDDRRFTPHVTLARFNRSRPEEIEHFVVANNLFRLPTFEVNHFCLIASYLTKSGSIYEDMAEYPLRQQASD